MKATLGCNTNCTANKKPTKTAKEQLFRTSFSSLPRVCACACWKVDDDKLRVLIAHLLDHPVLSELDMCHNAISDRGARALGKLLSGRSQLTKLCLSNNNIQVLISVHFLDDCT